MNRKSEGRFITARVELDEGFDAAQIDTSSVALILDGHTMLYAEPENVKISDYNENGIADLTVKFDRQQVLESIGNGDVEISITGLVDGVFFQEDDTIRVLGNPPAGLEKAGEQHGRPQVPFVRPGGRGM